MDPAGAGAEATNNLFVASGTTLLIAVFMIMVVPSHGHVGGHVLDHGGHDGRSDCLGG